MPNEIYHRSNWGESKAEGFGDVYYDHAATNKLYNHSDYYENSDGTDATLKDLNNKASIVLTPTAYSDGSLNTVIPPYQVLPTELVTNGTFDTDSDWLKSSTATISNGSAHIVSDGSYQYIGQVLVLTVGKKYRVEYEIVENNSGSLKMSSSFGSNFNPISSTVGFHSFEAVAIASTLYIERQSSCDIKIDNVSVKEIQEADFDFSRGSSATRVNEQGLVEDVQILSGELVQNGDFEQIGAEEVTNGNFDTDSDWTKDSGWSIESGEAIHTGSGSYITQTGTTIGKIYKVVIEVTQASGSGFPQIYMGDLTTAMTSAGTYTFYITATSTLIRLRGINDCKVTSISVKEVGQNWTFGTGWSMGDGKVVADGTMSASNNLIQSYNFTDGNKYRFSFTISDYQSGSIFIRQPFSGGADAVSANGTFTFDYIAGSANEIRFRSNDGFIGSLDNVSYKEVTDDTDLPRIDFTDGTGSLLLEPQRTNTFVYSEDYSQSNWIKSQITATDNSIVSPDGSLNASLITISSSTPYLGQSQTLTSGTTYTMSAFVKKGTNRWVRLAYVSSSSNAAWFDLENNVVGTQNGYSISASIENYGNGWYRITNTFTSHSSSGNAFLGLSGADNSTDATGVIGNTVYVWGLQVTQGDYPTSYIPTESSTVTRSADVANNSGNADLFNDSEGVLYAEIAALNNNMLELPLNPSISISDGSLSNAMYIYFDRVNSKYAFAVFSGSSLVCNIKSDTVSFSQNAKIAAKFKQDDFALYLNGTQVATDTSGNTPSGLSSLQFDRGDGQANFYGKTKCVAVFKEALSNDLLERLTGEGYESFRLLAEANNYTII